MHGNLPPGTVQRLKAALERAPQNTSDQALFCPPPPLLRSQSRARVQRRRRAPDFRRTDKPAELWQYRHDKCSVDLFLYPRDGGGLSVDFMAVRTYGGQDLSLQACFVAILKAKTNAGGRG